MSRFLNAFFNLADPSVGHFTPLIDSFLSPMRSLAGNSITSVLAEVTHRQLRQLHTVVPYLIPIKDVVSQWVLSHSLSTAENILRIQTNLQSATLHYIASYYNGNGDGKGLSNASGSGQDSNPFKPPKPPKTVGDPKTPQNIDLGCCKGWCFSIFYKGTCKRLKSKRLCTYSENGTTIALKHTAEFNALNPKVKQQMQTYFQDTVEKSMTKNQVKYYSTP
jgi:hypothetical protein